MPAVISTPTRDPAINTQVRERHAASLAALHQSGFEEICTLGEAVFPFSFLLLTPIYWAMRAQKEILQIEPPLRIVTYYPLLGNREAGAYALVNALNVKFYSHLADGTLVISVNSPTQEINDPVRKVFKQSVPGAVERAWSAHREEIEQRDNSRTGVQYRHQFQDYDDLSRREAAIGNISLFRQAGCWLGSILIPLGLIVPLVVLPWLTRRKLPAEQEQLLAPALQKIDWISALITALLVLVSLQMVFTWRNAATRAHSADKPAAQSAQASGSRWLWWLILLGTAVVWLLLLRR